MKHLCGLRVTHFYFSRLPDCIPYLERVFCSVFPSIDRMSPVYSARVSVNVPFLPSTHGTGCNPVAVPTATLQYSWVTSVLVEQTGFIAALSERSQKCLDYQ
jgi:hypothetical protein